MEVEVGVGVGVGTGIGYEYGSHQSGSESTKSEGFGFQGVVLQRKTCSYISSMGGRSISIWRSAGGEAWPAASSGARLLLGRGRVL